MYTLELTREELRTLAWVADRYQSASVLYDGMCSEDDLFLDGWWVKQVYTISENVAWEYKDEIDTQDSGDIIPPCIGGTLADKLAKLYEEIV